MDDERSLNLSWRALIEVPVELIHACLEIKVLNLSHNQLSGSCLAPLQNLIDELQHLLVLNISHNYIPANAVLILTQKIEEKNRYRTLGEKILLVSDFSIWAQGKPQDPFSSIFWTLSEYQWRFESNSMVLFNNINEYVQQDPQILDQFLPAFSPQIKHTNAYGWTPLISCIKHGHMNLVIKFAMKLGIEDFFTQLIRDCTRKGIQYLCPEHFVSHMLLYLFLNQAKRPDLAHKVVQTLLPHSSGHRIEALGNIALYEKNYLEAYNYYMEGINAGVSSSYYTLVTMMRAQCLPDILPYDPEKLNLYLKSAADQGLTIAKIDYGLSIENHSFSTAFNYFLDANLDLTNNTNIVIPDDFRHKLGQRILFGQALELFYTGLLEMRTSLAKARYETRSQYPGYCAFSAQKFQEALDQALGETPMKKLLNTHRHTLFQTYLRNDALFNELTEHFSQAMKHSTHLNKGLLSMSPEEYGQALCEQVQFFLDSHPIVGIRMTSGGYYEPLGL